uniref:CDGSH iron-sulfur domain-containing protein 2 n=1 Tax=Nomascus leucogenys TaxID=61853 RepID=A0A2I3GH55_NOMLE
MSQGLLSSELSPVSFRGKILGFCREGLGTGQCLSSPVLLIALFSEWLRLLPFLGVLALLGYLAVRPFLPKKKQQKDSLINLKIQKENPKVVNEINIEDLCLTKAAYCRCWRSKTFPACDGSHNKHNELTGDNVGPLILKKKEV